MNCLSDEVLRARLDSETRALDGISWPEAERHLAACDSCRTRLLRLEREALEVAQSLGALKEASPHDPWPALARFRARREAEAASAPRRRFLAVLYVDHPIPAWGVSALAALVLLLTALAPARSLAQRVLSMLRVQKVTVVPVDFTMPHGADTSSAIRQVISNDVTVTLSAGKPQPVPGALAASRLTGFRVRAFTGASSAAQVSVVGEQGYLMTLDVNRLQEVLNDIGRTDLQIPASVNGQTIAVHIPKSAFLLYGNCPAPGQRKGWASMTQCIMLAEVPSPVVSVPPGLDINALAQIALEGLGMSAQQAAAFCQTVDWKSTLVIPIPIGAISYQQEQVDGVEGTLIMGKAFHGRPADYALLWVKKGIVYSIRGFGNPEKALALAGTLG